MAVVERCFITLVLLALGTAAAMMPDNDTRSIVRTFSGFFLTVTDEPFDYLDVQEGSGSGMGSEREQRPSVDKGRFYISKEASQFLRGRLATVFVPTVYTLVFLTSVPLNLLALVAFVRRVRPKKPAAIYMMNLACADLLFALFLPFRISYHYGGHSWQYGEGMCRLVTAAFYCNMYCSVLLVTAISVDRLAAVVYPTDSLVWRTPRNAWAACAAAWLLSSAGVFPLLLAQQTLHVTGLDVTTCHDVLDVRQLRSYYVYFFPVFSALFFFVPFLLSAACYYRIIRVLCGVAKQAKRHRAVLMAATVFVVFAVCFAPANVILVTHSVHAARGQADSSYAAYLLAMCAGSASCSLDPLLYYFGSSRCHKVALDFLTGRSRWRSEAAPEGTDSSQSTRSSKLDTFKSNASGQYSKLAA
ncbi:proteinase-activated receptor 1 [Salminus brasiliensis]|uniref:proteinase-activated receptor 1 n=1 Tax=Salminus brasiliensis TaxID=930266 RepID=UPI003B82F428